MTPCVQPRSSCGTRPQQQVWAPMRRFTRPVRNVE